MEILYAYIYILFTYIFSGTVLFLLTIRFIPSYKYYKYYKVFYILFLGMGPMTIAWFLENIMYFMHGFSKQFYIAIIFLIFMLPLLYILKYSKLTYKKYIILIRQYSKLEIIVALLLLLILSSIILLPVIGNDTSQYYYVSQNVFIEKDFHFYPLIESGMYKGYFPWTHPAGYISLLTWGYFFSHGLEHLYLLKTINVFYAFLTYILMVELLKNYADLYAKTVALLIFMSPLYCMLIPLFHIDIFRIFLFLTPFVFLKVLLEVKDKKLLYIIAISLASSAYAHSIGILSIFFVGTIILIYSRKLLTVKNVAITILILSMVLVSRYYQNYQIFGYIIGDKSPIWSLDFIHYDEFLATSRHLDSYYNIIVNGIFRGFSSSNSFAYTFPYLVIVTILITVRDKITKKDFFNTLKSLFQDDKMFKISLFVLTLWYLLTILSTILGGYSFIKNDRYVLTIYPFIIYMSAILTLELIIKQKKKVNA